MSVFSRNHGSLTCLFDPTLSYLHTAPLWHKCLTREIGNGLVVASLFLQYLLDNIMRYCAFFSVCVELFDSLQGTPSILNMLEIFDHVTYQILSQVVHG